MKAKIFFLFFIFVTSSKLFSQQFIFGKITNDSSSALQDVVVMNMRTEEKTFSDRYGTYMIAALPTDELRFAKGRYERGNIRIKQENFSAPLNIVLVPIPIEIAEIELGFKPTGNLRKDSKALDQPARVAKLNNDLELYLRSGKKEPVPENKIPSAFAPSDYKQGQISLLSVGGGESGGLLGLVAKSIKRKVNPKMEPNFAETHAFYARIRAEVDLEYFRKFGLDEYQLDQFIVYADKKFQLAKNFRNNFNAVVINTYLRTAFEEYIKTHKVEA